MKYDFLKLVLILAFVAGCFAQPAFAWQDAETADAVEDDKDAEESLEDRMAAVQRLARNDEIEDAMAAMEGIYEDFGDENVRVGYTYLQMMQQIGMQKAQEDRESGNDLFYKSGKLAREMWKKSQDHPAGAQSLIASCIYNEACTYGIDGKKDDALKYLALSFEAGFDDFDLAASDSDFGDLLETEEFKAVISDAKKAIVEKKVAALRKSIEEFDSYDFDFDLEDVTGNTIKKDDYKGKVLIVDIWGTWCPPCRKEIPSFIKLKKKYADKLEIVGLAYERVDDDEEALENVEKFMKKHKMNYPCAIGTDEIKEQVPKLRGYPTTLFIDQSGNVKMELVGFRPYEELEATLKIVMGETN